MNIFSAAMRKAVPEFDTVAGKSLILTSNLYEAKLSNGLVVKRGCYLSLCPTQKGLSLNIDISAIVFYEAIKVVDFVRTFLSMEDIATLLDHDIIKVTKILRGVKVQVARKGGIDQYTITGCTYRTNNLMITTAEKDDAGNEVYLSMEACQIVAGQTCSSDKLTQTQVSLLSKVVEPPHEWKHFIRNLVKRLISSKLEFGYKVREDFASISDARVLNPPKLKCHDTANREIDVHPRNGKWDMKDKQLFNGVAVRHWVGVNLSSELDEKKAYTLMLKLVDLCKSRGMIFSHQPLHLSQLTPTDDIERKLVEIQEDALAQFQVEEEEKIQLAIVILPNMVDGSYGLIKSICETRLGVVSQCIDLTKVRSVRGFSSQYFEDLAFKINAKVGGQNTPVIDCHRSIPTPGRTILFWACLDPPPLGEDGPTILAVVASVDWPGAYDYRCLFSSQPEGKELQNMISNHFMRFRRNVHFLPDRIIFYRGKVKVN